MFYQVLLPESGQRSNMFPAILLPERLRNGYVGLVFHILNVIQESIHLILFLLS